MVGDTSDTEDKSIMRCRPTFYFEHPEIHRLKPKRNMHFTVLTSMINKTNKVQQCSGLLELTRQEINYEPEKTSDLVAKRLIQIMRTYSEETKSRVGEMISYRGYYDTSAQFEMGYVVSEILERYLKMIENIKSPYEQSQRSNSLAFVIKRCEYVQKLFFEIFQLGNMIHEIERKWAEMLKREKGSQFENGAEYDRETIEREIDNNIERARKNRLKAQKKRRKERLQREKFSMIADRFEEKDRRPPNKWWPIDYGWEIDYYW